MRAKLVFLAFALCPALLFSQAVSGTINFGGSVSFNPNIGPTVTANFSNRDNSTPVVAAGFLGVGGVGHSLANTTAITLLNTTGLNQTRFFAFVDQLDATGSMVFTSFDADINRALAGGFKPSPITITGTPPSLGASICTVPSNFTTWANLAAAVVHHMDVTFPGVATDYEIWSEPDGQASLCAGSTAANLTAYLSIYAAAGSAIRAQATTDGIAAGVIHIGGPALGGPANNASWVTSLVTSTSPNTKDFVDFVSLHIYVTGQFDINQGMDWPYLYNKNQSATLGVEHYYQAIEALVRAGLQPNAANTPIWITEYNSNNAFALSCCQNDPTYGPLYNSVAIADLLNATYSGATRLPTNINYFAATNSAKYFCLVGVINAQMDCDGSSYAAYPQLYTYKLFASSSYLGLEAGGHMAASVTPLPPINTTLGFGATAFYTASNDSIVIVNPSAAAYASVPVTMNNAAFSSATGTIYTLNAANSTITSTAATLTPITNGYTASLTIPAFSTVALSIAGSTTASTPTLSVAPGTYNTAQVPALSSATPGATIYYTLDGSTPTTSSAVYSPSAGVYPYNATASGILAVTSGRNGQTALAPLTIKAMATHAGMANSGVVTGTYTLTTGQDGTAGQAQGAATGTAVHTCGTDLTTTGTYFVDLDMNCPDEAFLIDANNITLNLNGHTIVYDTAGASATKPIGALMLQDSWFTGYRVNTTTMNHQNFHVYGGTINQASTGNSRASYSILAGQTNGIGNLTIDHVAFNTYAQDAGVLYLDGAVIVNFQNNLVAMNAATTTNRHQYFGYAIKSDVANNTSSTGTNIYSHNTIAAATQGFVNATYQGTLIQYNDVTMASTTTNDFIVISEAINQKIQYNNFHPVTGRGVHVIGANSDVSYNRISTKEQANNAEYGGCEIGGAYALQTEWDKSVIPSQPTGNVIHDNTLLAQADQCYATGFRLTGMDTGANTTIANNSVIGSNTGGAGFDFSIEYDEMHPGAVVNWGTNYFLNQTAWFLADADGATGSITAGQTWAGTPGHIVADREFAQVGPDPANPFPSNSAHTMTILDPVSLTIPIKLCIFGTPNFITMQVGARSQGPCP
jgi:hypothetical protein